MCSYGKLGIMLDDGETEKCKRRPGLSCEVKRNSYCSYMTYSLLVTRTLVDTLEITTLCIQVDLICIALRCIWIDLVWDLILVWVCIASFALLILKSMHILSCEIRMDRP